MSEKLDGVRAHWNGEKLLTRQGKELNCPKWFSEGLPVGVRLDGELWMGRGTFDKLMAALNLKGSLWRKEEIKYVLFDLVDLDMTYEQRMDVLKSLNLPSFVSVIEVVECRGGEHLHSFLQSVVACNGEGIMVTEPKSRYIGGRTASRLKVKVIFRRFFLMQQMQSDSDVQVLKVTPNGLACLQYVILPIEVTPNQIQWKSCLGSVLSEGN
jgi:DNA ligase 1